MKLIVDRLRAVRALLLLIARSDPRRAAVALTPVLPAAAGLSFLSVRQLLHALARDDRVAIAGAAALFTVAFIATVWLGRVVRTTRISLGELTVARFHRRRLEAVLGPDQVDHLERADYLDRLELLRTRTFDIGQSPRMLGWLVDSGGGIAVSVGLLLSVRPPLALVVLGGLPSAYLNGRAQRRIESVREVHTVSTRRALHLYDVATKPSAAKEVRVSNLGEELLGRYATEWRGSDRALFGAELRAAGIQAIGWLLQAATFAVGVFLLVDGVRDGNITPADVFIALGAMGLVVGQFSQAAGGLSSIGRISRLFEHLDAIEAEARESHPDVDLATGAGRPPLPTRLTEGIALEDVRFRYAGSDTDALAGVSLSIPAGTVVALVGDNGAGKSTFVKLLFGLYRPTGGRIRIDGSDLGDLALEGWRLRTSACFQDFVKLELIARESVGSGDLTRVEDHEFIGAAVGRAAATDVIAGLPAGIESQLGARFGGAELSGGQWQKLAIARAMMRNAPLLLALDEPTGALDPLAEQEIFRGYAAAAREVARTNGAITLLVSHRFSTVRMADLIVVLDQGRILEAGAHDDLMSANGRYAELYELQAKYYR